MPVRVSIHCWVPLYKPSLSSSLLDRAEEESGKRKREDGDDMAALEAAVIGTRLQGFVSGGTVQPDQRTQDEAAAAVAPGAECTKSLPLLHLRSKGVCDDVLSFPKICTPVLPDEARNVCSRCSRSESAFCWSACSPHRHPLCRTYKLVDTESFILCCTCYRCLMRACSWGCNGGISGRQEELQCMHQLHLPLQGVQHLLW